MMKRTRATIAMAVLATSTLSHVTAKDAHAAEPQTVTATPKPFAYGIFVGSNTGGAGQAALRYAERDARIVAETLREVGRYGASDMRILASPAPTDVLSALDTVGARLREHEKKGEQALLIFYFSGHAKANALHLGGKELELEALRDRLRGLPSTLTLIVLDTCQSGAFARTKGSEPAADFSINSVARLQTRGTAVMASSTSQELSQESDELRSSFFTHHLLVALRGAGDQDRDGRVTLDFGYTRDGAALAIAAGLVFVFGEIGRRPDEHAIEGSGEPTRTKGATIGFTLVRDDHVELGDAGGVYRDGERFKARISCPVDLYASWDLVVLERGDASFLLTPPNNFVCGNGVYLPGALRLVGHEPLTICLLHREGGLVDRDEVRRSGSPLPSNAVCKVLTPAR